MSFSSLTLVLAMCSLFFCILFTLEGVSDDGWEGVKMREKSIIGSISCFIVCFALFLLFARI